MNFDALDLLVNVVAMLFWFRLWMPEVRDIYFNPHLSSVWRLTESLVTFLKPVLIGLSSRIASLIAIIFLLVFKGVVIFGLVKRSDGASWGVEFGFQKYQMYAGNQGLMPFLAFSFISFGIFLFLLWSIALLYAGGKRANMFNHAAETVFNVARPLTLAIPELRPVVLVLYGMVIALLLNADISAGTSALVTEHFGPTGLYKLLLISLREWVMALSIIQVAMIVLIIASWAAMFSTSPALAFFCRDWIDLLVGPLRRIPLRLGPLDLTPLLAYFLIVFVQGFLILIIDRSYSQLP